MAWDNPPSPNSESQLFITLANSGQYHNANDGHSASISISSDSDLISVVPNIYSGNIIGPNPGEVTTINLEPVLFSFSNSISSRFIFIFGALS